MPGLGNESLVNNSDFVRDSGGSAVTVPSLGSNLGMVSDYIAPGLF